ncbi:hypothetical protein RB595_010185 [Gaeumannomyces hyphopodioides]
MPSSVKEEQAESGWLADDGSSRSSTSAGVHGDAEYVMAPSRWRRHASNPVIVLLAVLCALVTTLLGVVLLSKPTDNQCARQLSVWSPALEAVEYVSLDFDNAFNSTSKYRGPPTPEVEQAWHNLTFKHAVEIPEDKISALNRSEKDNLHHVPPDVGTGYVALIEVFHQLHCLNLVRMFTWYQAGKYPGGAPPGLFPGKEDAFRNRMHVDHCLETLRIALMCWGDVTPVVVRKGGPVGGRADFNSHHKCRNWDKLESWMDNNWSVS